MQEKPVMSQKPFYDQRFDSIQSLRGIAAVFVILEHIRFINHGAFGVDIFFVISGFMIMYTTHSGKKAFFRKRLIRILPLYYLMTLGTYLGLLLLPELFEQTTANIVYLVKSLLFIPFDIGGGAIQPLMRIGWTVNCEMFFYLIFFLSMHINHRYRGLICSILIGLVMLLAHMLPISWIPLTFYGNPVMLEFILGIGIFYLAKFLYEHHYDSLARPLTRVLALTAIVGIFAVLLATKPYINILGFRRPLVWGIPGALLLLSAFLAGIPTQHTLSQFRRFPVQLGNMSYSIYLIHYYPVLFLDRQIFHFTACTPFTLFGAFVCVIVSILIGAVSWYLIEQKLTGWLRRRWLNHEKKNLTE